jgi:mRNA-degrading endonuclease RelE of RelBE toxin-antitoxin system
MKIEISSGAKKDLKKLDKKVALKIIKEIFPILQQNPHAGSELSGDLHGLRSFHLIHQGVHLA